MSFSKSILQDCFSKLKSPVTLFDPSCDTCPIVYANKAFIDLDECRSCFFGAKFFKDKQLSIIKNSFMDKKASYCDLISHTVFGEPLYNRVIFLPITLKEGDFYIGLQAKIDKISSPFHFDFDENLKSEEIKDKFNNLLMMLFNTLDMSQAGSIIQREIVNL